MSDPFPQTRWSLVIEAQGDPDAPSARRALDELCRTYWYPIYSYARRRGYSPADAEDHTQSFFARILSSGSIDALTPEKGRMRAFLLTSMRRFLSTQRRNENSLKRGGGHVIVSIDLDEAESRFAREPVDPADTPDRAFEKAWAHSVLGTVYAALERYYAEAGKSIQFAALCPFLTWGDDNEAHAGIAAKLGMNESSVRTAIHRLRARYRTLLEAEIRETVTSRAEAAEELSYLKRILTGR